MTVSFITIYSIIYALGGGGLLKFNIPIIVEGKYDKAKLSGVVGGVIITTDGFGVFRSDEKKALIRRLGSRGVIILSDSDGGGTVIRSHLKGMLGGIKVYNLYIPQIEGKERRKSAPSKEGFLGVEGIPAEILREIFEDFAAANPEIVENGAKTAESAEREPVTKAFMYEMGLNGGENSSENRKYLCKALGLPPNMTVNALCEALNLVSSAGEIRKIMQK